MGTARPRVANCEYDLAGQLVFHVDVKLLYPALLEIRVLRDEGPGEIKGVRRRSKYGESIGNADCRRRLAILRGTGRGGECTRASENERVGFSVVGRILPQPLSALVPG